MARPSLGAWQRDLQLALALNVPHISAYCLTIEPKTYFGKLAAKGQLNLVPDEYSATQYDMLVHGLGNAGYLHYEVSNFAWPGMESKHNRAYWQQKSYLGIGPSAHSYNGNQRQYNISSNAAYLQAVGNGQIPATIEQLTRPDKVNDYLLTSLRTSEGCNLHRLKAEFQYDLLTQHAKFVATLQERALAVIENNYIRLTTSGRFLADGITSELMLEN